MFAQESFSGTANQPQSGMKIYETMQYEIFSFVDGNRELNSGKVNQLTAEIKKNGLLMPIMVNNAYQIIDGQHRFHACKLAKVPVQYFVRANATVDTAANVNMAGSNWSPADWVNKYASDGNEDYVELKKWIDKCAAHGIKQAAATYLAQNSGANHTYAMFSDGQVRMNGNTRASGAKRLYVVGTAIRLGKWTFGDRKVANDLLNTVLLFRSCGFYHRPAFITAIIRASRIEGFDPLKLHAQYLKYPEKFTDERTSDKCLKMFEEVYNFSRAQKNRLAIVNNPGLQKK
jgi:hypothetical protein